MKKTNINLCPELYTEMDEPDSEWRLLKNISRLQAMVDGACVRGKKVVSAKDVSELLWMIMEIEEGETHVSDTVKVPEKILEVSDNG